MAAAAVREPPLPAPTVRPRPRLRVLARPGAALRQAASSSPFFTARTVRWRTVLNAHCEVPCVGAVRQRAGVEATRRSVCVHACACSACVWPPLHGRCRRFRPARSAVMLPPLALASGRQWPRPRGRGRRRLVL